MKLFPSSPPPGPFREEFWRSPLRGPWLTSLLGLVLLIGLPILALTGLLSNLAYDPGFASNDVGTTAGLLGWVPFRWPAHPVWLYALTQGTHVALGLALSPILLAKLWSVIPKLFEWPPVRSPAHVVERLSLLFLVASGLFEFATGILNIQNDYAFGFFFTPVHYYGAWVFIAAVSFHVAIKLPKMRRSLKTRSLLASLREDVAHTGPDTADPHAPAVKLALPPSTMTRRVLLGTVGGASALLGFQGLGQSLGGPLRGLAFLAPRGRNPLGGPNGFQINKSFAASFIDPGSVNHSWRLTVQGRRMVTFTREQLLAMPQRHYDLPIACVEGWSTTQRWSGVRMRDLAALAGTPRPTDLTTQSLEQNGLYSTITWSPTQAWADEALLALQVNRTDLSLDHGFPARAIGPAIPGVHCTKWITMLTFAKA
ncbi:MAG: molybdopterin-dependent oxidoreductase [Actinomycetota bacterium]|nr:molybdopterin-dependent oxidoreductase [Actinomycetota bacterium]